MTQEKSIISYQVVLGDSLSEGGELQHRKPLLASAAGLSHSPYGRFTDGYTWADDLARIAALDLLKEQFIAYIINAIQPEKLDNPEVEIEEFKQYIRAIDLEKFHPDTFRFDKFKDSYLKRHLIKEKIIIYLSSLLETNEADRNKGIVLLAYFKSLPLESFHPDTFDLQALLTHYKQTNSCDDQFSSFLDGLINEAEIDEIIKKSKDTYKMLGSHDPNIFDTIDPNKFNINHLNENLRNFLYGSFSLGNYERILFQGHNFVRRFAEGGLSAHHYWPLPDLQTLSLILKQVRYTLGQFNLSFQYLSNFVGKFFMLLGEVLGSRAMLSCLEEKATSLLQDDKAQNISLDQKAKTLVTEWTGANDFITMEASVCEQVCDDAIKARMDNILKLAKEGYKHFLLLDLPDLGKTPRYMNRSEKERAEMSRLVAYFNEQLTLEIEKIRTNNPQLDIKLFPLHDRFNAIYNDPASFGLSKDIDKLHPLVWMDPKEANTQEHMFWDDVHPSNKMHHVLAQEIYHFEQQNYCLQPPVEIEAPCCPVDIAKGLLITFRDKYTRSYNDYKNQLVGGMTRFFGFGSNRQNFNSINFTPGNLEQAKQSLAELYQLSNHDKIVKQSMIDMGWLQKNGQLPTDCIAPILGQAYKMANFSTSLEENQPLPKEAVLQFAI